MSHLHTVVLPLGATEQHGRHLPADTDARIAAAVASRTAANAVTGLTAKDSFLVDDKFGVTLLPALAFGASGEHAGFAGLASIGTEVLVSVLVELGRSVCEWADRLVIVNAHGGNLDALKRAVPQLRAEGRDVGWFGCVTALDAGDTHAGAGETSIMLALDPDAVDLAAAERGCTRPINELLPLLREGGVAAVSSNGVLGDPRDATVERGERLLEANVRAAVAAMRAWNPDEAGKLSASTQHI